MESGFSLRASSPGRSGGGAGKGRRACNYVSEFEFHLQFPCGSQSTELSEFCRSARSGNEHEGIILSKKRRSI